MLTQAPLIGAPIDRVDGPVKVTGRATYVAEFPAADLAHGHVLCSSIAHGRIAAMDVTAALALSGVIRVFTHENRPRTAWFDRSYSDDASPPGSPFRPLYDDNVLWSGQPIALVVAEDMPTARLAASLIRVTYEEKPHETELDARREQAYVPPKTRAGQSGTPKPRGDVGQAMAASATRIEAEYRVADEHHNPMEMHATTVVWNGDEGIVVHDKTQGPQNSQAYVHSVFGIPTAKIRVIVPYLGGGFGSALRPHYNLFLAVMAAMELERSVRVMLSRDQMFTHTHRPETINTVALGADGDGTLRAIRHEAIAATSTHEDHQENVVSWSGLLYACDNVALSYKLAKLDIASPGDMRAPGAPTGQFALESAMDELANELGMCPMALRLHNMAEDVDQNSGKKLTSKALRLACEQGAERFGWARRNAAPRSMREGRELIGWGMATGVWEALFVKTSARAVLDSQGRLEIAVATAEIGTGTYTILSQVAADALGVPLDRVTTLLGDSSLPAAPLAGGSWTAASSSAAVQLACESLRKTLLGHARKMNDSPLANVSLEQVVFAGGRIVLASDPLRFVSLSDALRAGGVTRVEAEETAKPSMLTERRYAAYTHQAVFCEVRVDEQLGHVRITRMVNAVAAGRILNPKTARSQIIGGAVMGIGMALHEEALTDHAIGRIMNHNFGEYHVPVNADIPEMDVLFVEEEDSLVSPLGVKGLGEIGVVGTAAAVANAIHHATGKRVRELPITIDRLMAA